VMHTCLGSQSPPNGSLSRWVLIDFGLSLVTSSPSVLKMIESEK